MITRGLAAALALALVLAGWQWYRATSAIAELTAERQAIAQQIQAATDSARAEEQRRTLKIQEAQDAEQIARQAAEADAGRARSAAVSLRQRAAELAASCTASNPTATTGGPTAIAPGLVLADMLGRVAAAAGELGGYADRARGAGQLCERSYEALRP
jgi:hypothetical protein